MILRREIAKLIRQEMAPKSNFFAIGAEHEDQHLAAADAIIKRFNLA